MHRWFKMDEKHADGLLLAREAGEREIEEKKEARTGKEEDEQDEDEQGGKQQEQEQKKDDEQKDAEKGGSTLASAIDGLSRWASGTEAQEKSRAAKQVELAGKKDAAKAAHRARAAGIGARARAEKLEKRREAVEKAGARDAAMAAELAESAAVLERELGVIAGAEEVQGGGEL